MDYKAEAKKIVAEFKKQNIQLSWKLVEELLEQNVEMNHINFQLLKKIKDSAKKPTIITDLSEIIK